MAFNFFKWITGKTEEESPATVLERSTDFLDDQEYVVAGLHVYLQKMAFWTCVRKIGNAVGAVEWETYRRGKSVRAKEYWAWNYSPNPNQNRQEFFMKLISQLFLEQEALVVEYCGNRYVADGFSANEQLSGNVYSNVTCGGKSIPGTFRASDVLHFVIDGDRIKSILSAISAAEGELIKAGSSNFIRNSGKHGILRIDELAESDGDFEDTYSDLMNEKFKKYFTAKNAVLPLFNGYNFEEDESNVRVQETTRDIRSMMDDIVELTAQAFGMPVTVATGKEFTDADFETFMTFTVQPVVRIIAEEINRKVFGRDLVYSGTYVVPNMGCVKYLDLFGVANPIDKLIGSGAFCINDIRIRLGVEAIDAPWARQHWMTKNYSMVEDVLGGVDGGGDKDGEQEEKENGGRKDGREGDAEEYEDE